MILTLTQQARHLARSRLFRVGSATPPAHRDSRTGSRAGRTRLAGRSDRDGGEGHEGPIAPPSIRLFCSSIPLMGVDDPDAAVEGRLLAAACPLGVSSRRSLSASSLADEDIHELSLAGEATP